MEEKIYPPVYRQSFSYALEHGEIDEYRASNHLNGACCAGVEKAVRDSFDGTHLDKNAAIPVMKEFGAERVAFVLASTVLYRNYDGRLSADNKTWAAGICPVMSEEMKQSNPIQLLRPDAVVACHPAVLNGFIDLFRNELMKSRQIAEAPDRLGDTVKTKTESRQPEGNRKSKPKRRGR